MLALAAFAFALAVHAVHAGPARADGPTPDAAGLADAIEATGLSAGLAVTLGVDAATDRAILGQAPGWLLLSLPGDAAAADARREQLRDAAGRAVVQPRLGGGVPVYPRAAAALVVDADALGDAAPTDAEIDRALRPFGTAFVKRDGRWTSRTAPWPGTIADLTHWLGDHRLSSQVPDEEIGRVRSLRWHTAREDLAGGQVWAAGGVLVAEVELGGEQGLAGFDAFTGLQLWHRPGIRTGHNYTTSLDGKRLVIREVPIGDGRGPRRGKKDEDPEPVYLKALDPKTGEPLLVYDRGPDIRSDRHVLANVVGGKLVVAATGSLTVLDAASGERLWRADHPGKQVMFPSVAGGRVACVIGPKVGDTAAHAGGLDREVLFDAAVCYDLRTGEQRWRWTQDKLKLPATTYAAFADGRYWVSLMPPQGIRLKDKPGEKQWFVARIDPATGAADWVREHPEMGPTDQFVRLFVFGDALMLHRGAQTFRAMDKASGELLSGKRSYDSMAGGCTHPRASAGYAYHATTSIAGDAPFWTHRANLQSGRCHKGGFPGQGMLFAADAGCDCDAFLRGLSGYGSDDPSAVLDPVTAAGPGRPGATREGDAWRTALRDVERSTWSPSSLDGELQEAWRVKLDPLGDAPEALADQWARHVFADTVSGPVVADGVLVVVLGQTHEVVGIAPETGEVRWRRRADSRVDGPVTLAGGMAVYGTTGGWVEAVSVDEGRLVWRTLVAPDSRYRVENGQVESSHPVTAPVAVVGEKVYAAAGVHTHVDGGIIFAELDLATGRLLRRVAVDGQPQPFTPDKDKQGYPGEDVFNPAMAAEMGDGKFQKLEGTYPSSELAIAYPEQRIGILTRTPEGWLGLGTLALDPASGEVKRGGVDFGYVNTGHWGLNLQAAPRYPVHVLAGHLSKDGDQVVMGGVRAKAIAYRDDTLIAVAGSDDAKWRYGPEGTQIARHRLTPDGSTEIVWKVPFEKRYDHRDRHWMKTGIRHRDAPETLAVAGDTALLATAHLERNDDHQLLPVAELTLYDLADGKVKQKLKLPARAAQAGIAVVDGAVYVACLDGTVVCYR